MRTFIAVAIAVPLFVSAIPTPYYDGLYIRADMLSAYSGPSLAARGNSASGDAARGFKDAMKKAATEAAKKAKLWATLPAAYSRYKDSQRDWDVGPGGVKIHKGGMSIDEMLRRQAGNIPPQLDRVSDHSEHSVSSLHLLGRPPFSGPSHGKRSGHARPEHDYEGFGGSGHKYGDDDGHFEHHLRALFARALLDALD